MPVAAARLTDVGACDPQPLVLGRGGQHPLEQLAIAGLELGALLQLKPGLADPRRQRVADNLQLAQAKRPRLTRNGADSGVDREARKGIGDEGAKLSFEAPDLTPQLSARKSLVPVEAKLSAYLSLKQIRHSPQTSVDQPGDRIAIVTLRAIPVGVERLVLFRCRPRGDSPPATHRKS